MEDKKLDQLLKRYILSKFSKQSLHRAASCPSDEVLNDYLYGYLSNEQEILISNHVAVCQYCLELLEQAQEGQQANLNNTKAPKDIINGFLKHKFCPHCGQTLNGKAKENLKTTELFSVQSWFRKNICLLFSMIALALSFLVHRFFMQFIILSAILGIKWAFDTGAKKTMVMIYQAWRKHSLTSEDQEVEDILKSRQGRLTKK